MKFLKALGLGIVYMLIFPFILLGSALYMLYGLGRWFVLIPVGIIRYFKGEKFFKPLKEDIEVEAAKKAQHDALLSKETEEPSEPVQPISNTNTTTYVQNNYYTNPNPQQMGPSLGAPINQQLGGPQYQQQPYNPQLNGPQYQQQPYNPQLTAPQYQQPYPQQIDNSMYQETQNSQYQQIPVPEDSTEPEEDEYFGSSIDNPMEIPGEGGDDQ